MSRGGDSLRSDLNAPSSPSSFLLPFLRSHLHFHYTEMPLTSFSCPFPSHSHQFHPRKTTVCIVTNRSTVVLFPSREDKLDRRYNMRCCVSVSYSIITRWSLFNPWYSPCILSISINLSLEGHSHPYRFSQCTKPRESYYVSSTLFPLSLSLLIRTLSLSTTGIDRTFTVSTCHFVRYCYL